MKAAWMGVVAASTLLLAGAAQSNEELAKKSGCMACHAADKKVVGPAFKDIAVKYKGDAAAESRLAKKVKEGGKGVWGEVPMPPNAAVKDDDVKTLVKWVLSQK